MITTDGGKTWKEHPIFDESRVATIERFSFDNSTNGTLIVDARLDNGKIEEYRTSDGGETWAISGRPLESFRSPIFNKD